MGTLVILRRRVGITCDIYAVNIIKTGLMWVSIIQFRQHVKNGLSRCFSVTELPSAVGRNWYVRRKSQCPGPTCTSPDKKSGILSDDTTFRHTHDANT